MGRSRVTWVLIAPAIVLLLVMTVVPTIYLLWHSLRNSRLLGPPDQFVGLDNYVNFLTNPDQLASIGRTLFFVAAVVTLQLVLGLLLAFPLATRTRANTVAGMLLLLPFAVTPVVAALMFKQLLDPATGWVNHYLGVLGLPSTIEWLSYPITAWFTLILLDTWQWTPFVALILTAGLLSLPQEPGEAAAIDGASAWQTFRYITLPLLLPFIGIALVLRAIQAFKTFDAFFLLTNGGPGTSTEIINLSLYRVALGSFRIGAAAASAIVLLILLSLLVPLLLRVIGRNADPEELAA
jgi:multiple sugar transport system permease protein